MQSFTVDLDKFRESVDGIFDSVVSDFYQYGATVDRAKATKEFQAFVDRTVLAETVGYKMVFYYHYCHYLYCHYLKPVHTFFVVFCNETTGAIITYALYEFNQRTKTIPTLADFKKQVFSAEDFLNKYPDDEYTKYGYPCHHTDNQQGSRYEPIVKKLVGAIKESLLVLDEPPEETFIVCEL